MKDAEILKKIIESRRSIFPRDYSGETIPAAILQEIMESAHFAPSHKKTKPWRLQLFEGNEKAALGAELAKIYRETTAPQHFLDKKHIDITHKIDKTAAIITISVNFSGLVPDWEEIAATAMAVQNMYLTANVHCVGCYWSSPGLMHHLGPFLKLEENQKCYGIFYLGMERKEHE